MRRFFIREEHHSSQPVVGWFYFSKITDMDFDRKNSEMQRRCDLLNVTKVFNGRIQTRPAGRKRHLRPRSGSTVCLSGVLASPVNSQGQLCTLGSEGLPWILGGPTTEGHELGLNWAGAYLFCLACRLFNSLPKKKYNTEMKTTHTSHSVSTHELSALSLPSSTFLSTHGLLWSKFRYINSMQIFHYMALIAKETYYNPFQSI